ncbi:hypothetical protein ACFW1J_26155 [Priestia aryabhattai]|uniref:hypothetical protein n=1 Tax=Priestia aryabhattai TaxID=412384 RepID=UPI00366E8BD9
MNSLLNAISNTMIKKGLVDESKLVNIQNSSSLSEDFYEYARNFRKAGWEVAHEMVKDADIAKLDHMFFPLTFLYRHSIELILKAIAFKYIKDAEDRITFLKDTFHNLSILLERIEHFIKPSLINDEERHQWLKLLLESMNDIDRESDSFRYPFSIVEDKYSKVRYYAKYFFEKQTHIDLEKLVNKMEIAFSILDTYYLENLTTDKEYKKYNSFFLEEGGDYYVQSVIGFGYNRSDMYIYINAYQESAKFLYNDSIDVREKMNENFFPLCYLYKNALELSLKDIILITCPQEGLKTIYKEKHNVLKLWKCIEKDILKHANKSEDDPYFIEIKDAIKKIHEFDANSDRFRYPIGKKLNYYDAVKKKYNMENYNNFFNKLINFLSGVSAQISDHKDREAEQEMEMRSYYDYDNY